MGAERRALRPPIIPKPKAASDDEPNKNKGCRYAPWAALMPRTRTFQTDVTVCPTCGGRPKLVALVQGQEGVASSYAASASRPRRPHAPR